MRIIAAIFVAVIALGFAQALAQQKPPAARADAQIDYAGFRGLAQSVEAYRAERLVSHADFERMAREPGTIVLDARSADAYRAGHIEGAINLPFTDFTDESLRAVLRDPNVRVLIYCNNNFS